MPSHYPNLNPEKALIWRIVHRDNIEWILDNGLHCANAGIKDPDYVAIGNAELISKRQLHSVPIAPNGTLGDYVPFYFTPFSPMMYNIYTGRGEVPRQENRDIVILVSSMHRIQEMALPFVFTDRHGYIATAQFFNDIGNLSKIDWLLLQARNFQRNSDDPGQIERYQAEALIYRHLPVNGLLGIVCYTDTLKQDLELKIKQRGLNLAVHKMTGWYF